MILIKTTRYYEIINIINNIIPNKFQRYYKLSNFYVKHYNILEDENSFKIYIYKFYHERPEIDIEILRIKYENNKNTFGHCLSTDIQCYNWFSRSEIEFANKKDLFNYIDIKYLEKSIIKKFENYFDIFIIYNSKNKRKYSLI